MVQVESAAFTTSSCSVALSGWPVTPPVCKRCHRPPVVTSGSWWAVLVLWVDSQPLWTKEAPLEQRSGTGQLRAFSLCNGCNRHYGNGQSVVQL